MDEQTLVDWHVRRFVYDVALQSGKIPIIADISASLKIPDEEIRAALKRLANGRMLVLQPETGEILMANPFSAVPTPFQVEVSGFTTFGNCIWDALGIPAMLHRNARIDTACGDCGLALEVSVIGGQIKSEPSIIHFAIPAHHWWDDIVFN